MLSVRREQKRAKLLQYAERLWGIVQGTEDERITAAITATRVFFERMSVGTRLRACAAITACQSNDCRRAGSTIPETHSHPFRRPTVERVDARQRPVSWLAVVSRSAFPDLRGKSSGSVGSQMTAYSCGGSCGIGGSPPHRIPVSPSWKAPMTIAKKHNAVPNSNPPSQAIDGYLASNSASNPQNRSFTPRIPAQIVRDVRDHGLRFMSASDVLFRS